MRRDGRDQRPALARAVFDDVPLGRTCAPRTGRTAAAVPSGTTDSNAICSAGGQVQVFAEDDHELRGQHQVAAAEHSHPEHVFAEVRILAQDLEQHAEAERLGAARPPRSLRPAARIRGARAPRDTATPPAGPQRRRRQTASANRCTAVSSVQAASAAASRDGERTHDDDATGVAADRRARIVRAPHGGAHREHVRSRPRARPGSKRPRMPVRRAHAAPRLTTPPGCANPACSPTMRPMRARPCARFAQTKLTTLESAGAPLTNATARFTIHGSAACANVFLMSTAAVAPSTRPSVRPNKAHGAISRRNAASAASDSAGLPRSAIRLHAVNQSAAGSTGTAHERCADRRRAAGRGAPWDSRRTRRRAASCACA